MRALALGIVFSAQLAAAALACAPPGQGRAPMPPLAAAIDELLPRASLTSTDRQKVAALREEIRRLAAAGDEAAARKTEEQAMRLLGYRKAWLRCGPGTFGWVKLAPPAGS